MKKIIATLSLAFGLALGACASPAEIEEVTSPATSTITTESSSSSSITTESSTTTMEAESEPIPAGRAPTLDELGELTYVETVFDGINIYQRPLSNDHYFCVVNTEAPAPAYDWFVTETGCSEAMSLNEIYSAVEKSINQSFQQAYEEVEAYNDTPAAPATTSSYPDPQNTDPNGPAYVGPNGPMETWTEPEGWETSLDNPNNPNSPGYVDDEPNSAAW